MKLKAKIILGIALTVFVSIYFCGVGIALAGRIFGKTVFTDDVSVETNVGLTGIAVDFKTNGFFTNLNILQTNRYILTATNLLGHYPLSTNIVVIFQGTTNDTTNAVNIKWDKKGGAAGYIVMFTFDQGTNFTNFVALPATVNSLIDTGTNITTMGNITNIFSPIPIPIVPWGTTNDNASLQLQINSNANDIAGLSDSNKSAFSQIGSNDTDIANLFNSNAFVQAQIDSNTSNIATIDLQQVTLNGATTSVAITYNGSTNKGLAVFEGSIQATGEVAHIRIISNRSVVLVNPDGGEAFGLGVFFEGSEAGMIIGPADAPFTPRIDFVNNSNPVPTAGMIVFHVGGGGSTIGGGFLVQGAGDIQLFQVMSNKIVLVTNAMFRAEAAATVMGDFTNKGLALLEGGAVIDGLTYPTVDGTSNQVLRTDGAGVLTLQSRKDSFGGIDFLPTNSAPLNIQWSSVFLEPATLTGLQTKTEAGTVVFDLIRQNATNTIRNFTVLKGGIEASTTYTNITTGFPTSSIPAGFLIGVISTNVTDATNWWFSIDTTSP